MRRAFSLLSIVFMLGLSAAVDAGRNPLWTWQSNRKPTQVVEVRSGTHPGDWNEYQPDRTKRFPTLGRLPEPRKSFGVCMSAMFWDLQERLCIWTYAKQIDSCKQQAELGAQRVTDAEVKRAEEFQAYWKGFEHCVWMNSNSRWQVYTRFTCRGRDFNAEKWEDLQKCHDANAHRLPESIVDQKTIDVGRAAPQEPQESPESPPLQDGPSQFSRYVHDAVRASRTWRLGHHLPLLGAFQHAAPPLVREAPRLLQEVERAMLSTP
ncbi:MAG: hypothetical protein M1826_004112 [Phylliscum demangeonii]|nr:MAG: hypothetical protein M1826_004112 [Phylliscum demangeonii]